ncbi:MAG: TonB-dependent receptor [Acidobacteria bacterium]|nr:TonB-dependent receptor [Acidobacteriota bacterium]
MFRPSFILSLALSIAAVLPLPARAAAESPTGSAAPGTKPKKFGGQVTVTATGEETSTAGTPAAVTVVDRQHIEDSQIDTLPGLLRRIPGLTVVQSGDAGGVTSVFMRGTNSNQTLVLFDGVRLNSPYFGGYDWSVLPTAGLERLEVVRGPFSALWGGDAMGGVVNLIPLRGSRGLAGNVFAEGGEQGWKRGQAQVSWGSDRLDVMASGFYREGSGTLENSDYSLGQGLVDAGFTWASGSRVGLLVQSVSSRVEIPFTGATTTPRRHQSSDQTLAAVPLSWRMGEHWDLQATLSHVERDFSFRDPDDPFGFTSSDTSADTDQIRVVATHAAGAHRLSFGGEWRSDTVSDRSTFGTNLDGREMGTTGLFVQDLWRVSRKVRLQVGARWDDAGAWGSQLSPRVGLGWRVARSWEVHASLGRGFRQPSVGELYFPFSGNPNLNPETSTSTELGAAYTPAEGTFRLELNAFTTSLDNLIELDYASYAFQNAGSADIQGVELAAGTLLARDLSLQGQVTWLHTENGAGNELLRRPEWSGSLTLSGRLGPESLRGDLTLLWVGRREDIDPLTFGRISTGGFLTADLALAWRVLPPLELTFRVQNLTDRNYEAVAGYPSPGRRFIGGLRASF